jgi:hypothetical protein
MTSLSIERGEYRENCPIAEKVAEQTRKGVKNG